MPPNRLLPCDPPLRHKPSPSLCDRSDRHVSLVQEAQSGLAKINASTAPTTTRPSQSPTGDTFDARNAGGGGDNHRRGPPSVADPATPLDSGPSPSPPPRPTPAPAQVSVQSRRRGVGPVPRGGGGKSHGDPGTVSALPADQSEDGRDSGVDADVEVGRLAEWRDELLATGMYTPQNPIVSELNRRIALASGGGGDVGGEAMPSQGQE